MDAHTRFQTQIVGALPAIAHYFEQLDLAATIDELVPWEGDVPLGTLVEVLIANRLLQPKALFRVGPWAQAAAVTDAYGVTAEQLNDDRLGRALERLAAHAPDIQAALVLKAIERFDLDVTQVHYDLTTVELYGAYEVETAGGQPPPTPMPAYGRTKSGRKHVKQVQCGLDVTGDGGVPVGHLPRDGNAGEVDSHLENLKLLARALPRGKLLYIADTKLDAPENLLTIAARKGQFLCGGALSPPLQDRYLALRGQLHRVHYFPDSQAKLPPEKRDKYQAVEVPEHLEGAVDGKTVGLDYRLIFVWSESKARQEARTRERHTAKIRVEFEAVHRNLGRYSLKTTEAIVRRLEAAKGKYAEGALFDYRLGRDEAGHFRLDWGLNAAALERWQALEGVYVLKTNLPREGYRLTKVLRTYKGQSQVERRFHHLKGPLAVAPMFLKNPERIAGLLCVLVWALMVLALMERQVRRELKGQPLYGLYPEGRPSPAPTGPALIRGLSGLCVVIVHQGGETLRRLSQLDPVQRRIIQLLGINSERLQTFKRRCGM
ncbi:MAG TPA: IS1634 family transposase [Gemmataceae bacterium]|nr:IS1634 family transposase [Gemmataceae bacterium]